MSKAPWGNCNRPRPIKTRQQRNDIPEISYYLDHNCTGGPTKGYVDETGAVAYVNREREHERLKKEASNG